MKKLLVGATLIVTMAVVNMKVAEHYYNLTKERGGFEKEYRELKRLTSENYYIGNDRKALRVTNN